MSRRINGKRRTHSYATVWFDAYSAVPINVRHGFCRPTHARVGRKPGGEAYTYLHHRLLETAPTRHLPRSCHQPSLRHVFHHDIAASTHPHIPPRGRIQLVIVDSDTHGKPSSIKSMTSTRILVTTWKTLPSGRQVVCQGFNFYSDQDLRACCCGCEAVSSESIPAIKKGTNILTMRSKNTILRNANFPIA